MPDFDDLRVASRAPTWTDASLGRPSGACSNWAAAMVFAFRRQIRWSVSAACLLAQVVGLVLGVWIAHAMFGEPLLEASYKLRNGPAQAFSDLVAAFGLIADMLSSIALAADATPMMAGFRTAPVGWFTSSTFFTPSADAFAGIASVSAPLFIAAQILGALVSAVFFAWLLKIEPAGDH